MGHIYHAVFFRKLQTSLCYFKSKSSHEPGSVMPSTLVAEPLLFSDNVSKFGENNIQTHDLQSQVGNIRVDRR